MLLISVIIWKKNHQTQIEYDTHLPMLPCSLVKRQFSLTNSVNCAQTRYLKQREFSVVASSTLSPFSY